MVLERITHYDSEVYKKALALYVRAFPEIERRGELEHKRVLRRADYHFEVLTESGNFLGIMLYWETESFIFLEHFAILESERNNGLGAKALDLLKEKGKLIILEIEDLVDDITKRRYAFYSRNGFVMTEHEHIQAKYELGVDDYALKILSYPYAISKREYWLFLNFMSMHIGIPPAIACDVEVRAMGAEDDREQVAKLICFSDEQIHSSWFDCIEDGVNVISHMIDLPTLYNRNNITVAVADGTVVGVLVGTHIPIFEEEKYLVRAFELSGVKCDNRTHEMYEKYFSKLAEKEECCYISKIAVSNDFRKRGIAAALINKITKDNDYCCIECDKRNVGAWRVFQRMGFEIIDEHSSAFGVPYYKLIKRV